MPLIDFVQSQAQKMQKGEVKYVIGLKARKRKADRHNLAPFMVLAANQEQQCHRMPQMPQKMLLLERNFTWAMRAMVLGRLDNSIEARNPSAPGAPGEFMS